MPPHSMLLSPFPQRRCEPFWTCRCRPSKRRLTPQEERSRARQRLAQMHRVVHRCSPSWDWTTGRRKVQGESVQREYLSQPHLGTPSTIGSSTNYRSCLSTMPNSWRSTPTQFPLQVGMLVSEEQAARCRRASIRRGTHRSIASARIRGTSSPPSRPTRSCSRGGHRPCRPARRKPMGSGSGDESGPCSGPQGARETGCSRRNGRSPFLRAAMVEVAESALCTRGRGSSSKEQPRQVERCMPTNTPSPLAETPTIARPRMRWTWDILDGGIPPRPRRAREQHP